MIVVSNTSPISNLAAIGQLDLLRHFYQRIVIPAAVYRELLADNGSHPGAIIQTLNWIDVRTVQNQALVTALRLELDEGEAAAIALAQELGADLILLDERLGRAVAARFGLRFIGLLGVLVEAKQQGLLPIIKPALNALRQAGFWISPKLYSQVSRAVGE